MSYLLDTNIISEIRKGSGCNPQVAKWSDRAGVVRLRCVLASRGLIEALSLELHGFSQSGTTAAYRRVTPARRSAAE